MNIKSDQEKLLYEEIVEQIQKLIKGLKIGDKLPPERTLAATFKVSRNCVREAIRTLSEKKILESRRGDGTYVCGPDESVLIDVLAHAIQVEKERLKDIFEFRRLVEPQIALLAAQNITAQELNHLKILVFEQNRQVLAGKDAADLDTQFHLCMAQAAHNNVFLQIIKTLNHILQETRSEFLQTEKRRRASIKAHINIIDALEKGDAKGACKAMSDHLCQTEHTIFDKNSKK